jgi:uncharacterized protein (DUF2267 family)
MPARRTLAGKPTKGAVAMDLRQLAGAVAERTGLSREESADITRAVLEGLADQISEGEAKHLAIDIPEPLAGPLAEQLAARRRHRTEAHPVALDEFVRQLSARAGQPERDARAGTGAVLAALRDAMSQQDYGHLMGQLPAAYNGLVAAVG